MRDIVKSIDCDVLVVGGGINGAGIARDAAGRGLSVVLCEKDDLAQHTSSASSKLIHGGLRYLEQYHFGLVRKALAEREVLLKSAPHIIRPLRFLMPHAPGMPGQRPAWMIRAGLFLYDHLARRDFLPPSGTVALRAGPLADSLQKHYAYAFAYSDARVDDARLVVLAALDARERGATILTRTRCARVRRDDKRWDAELYGPDGTVHVRARCLVNAAGPWAASFLQATGAGPAHAMRLVKGSHIVVPRLSDGDDAFLLQQPDGRIVFALPYEGAFTLVGTTDVDYDAVDPRGDHERRDLDGVGISAAETTYLCDAANRCFERRIGPADVVWSYAGVRPLIADGGGNASSASRDYRFELDTAGGAPLLSVFGGKVTTFRKLAEQAVDWIGPVLGRQLPAWTAHACLPGGDLYGKVPVARAVQEYEAWVRTRRQQFAWLPEGLLARYARSYGTRLSALLAHCRTRADLGEEIIAGLYEVEADYLVRQEWATCADDILWRRSKLGLHVAPGAAQRLDAWLAAWPAARRRGGVPVS